MALQPEVKDGILTLVVPLLRARHPAVLVHTRLETRGRWGLKLKVTLGPQDTPVTRNNHQPNPRGDASSSSGASNSGGGAGFGSGEGGGVGSAASPPAPRSNARFFADGTGGGGGGGGSRVSPLLSRPGQSYTSSSSSGAFAGAASPLFHNTSANNGAQFPSPASATPSSRSRTSSTSSSSGVKNFGGGSLSRSESVGTLSHGSAEKSGRPGLLGRLRSTSFFGKKSKNTNGGSDAGMVGSPSSGGGGGGYGTENEALELAHGQAGMVIGGHHMPSFSSAAPTSTPPPAPAPVIRESLASRINKAQLELESDGDY